MAHIHCSSHTHTSIHNHPTIIQLSSSPNPEEELLCREWRRSRICGRKEEGEWNKIE
ncbi:uncharacterized protein LOC130740400 [Lotus japonicus]|uniref:Uncharacterized protein n=1 Tax=Lotus japonicus TaxID=34305 RepID=I3T2I8_LOTJA|nr:uncharacterized protein LOC130740400 [Lotus japonicus]AFK46730.1 unknown [Lotus japonicus]